MAAYKTDIPLYQSATFQKVFRIGPCTDKTPLTGWRARSQWRLSLDSDEVLQAFTTENGGFTLDPVARTLTYHLSDADRDRLVALEEARFVHDVFLISPAGNTYPFTDGTIPVIRSVTRD